MYLAGEKGCDGHRDLFCVCMSEDGVRVSSCFHVEDVIQRRMNNMIFMSKKGVSGKAVATWRWKMKNGLLVWQVQCTKGIS